MTNAKMVSASKNVLKAMLDETRAEAELRLLKDLRSHKLELTDTRTVRLRLDSQFKAKGSKIDSGTLNNLISDSKISDAIRNHQAKISETRDSISKAKQRLTGDKVRRILKRAMQQSTSLHQRLTLKNRKKIQFLKKKQQDKKIPEHMKVFQDLKSKRRDSFEGG